MLGYDDDQDGELLNAAGIEALGPHLARDVSRSGRRRFALGVLGFAVLTSLSLALWTWLNEGPMLAAGVFSAFLCLPASAFVAWITAADRAHRRWQGVKDEVVYAEKLEALGETQGGLSVSGPAGGGLSEVDRA